VLTDCFSIPPKKTRRVTFNARPKRKDIMIAKVSLGFARLSDTELDNFAHGVISGITGNAAYPTPPVTMVNLKTATDDFTAKIGASLAGGSHDTSAKNQSRQALIGMLRPLAAYVQMSCHEDQTLLLSSGFQAQSDKSASAPLETPVALRIKNGQLGKLVGRVDKVKNASMYEGRIKGDTGDWLPSVFTGDSQHIVFEGLTPGKTYTMQIRALGGSTGQSDWSDPSSHMSM
jgi:hypothetical protein